MSYRTVNQQPQTYYNERATTNQLQGSRSLAVFKEEGQNKNISTNFSPISNVTGKENIQIPKPPSSKPKPPKTPILSSRSSIVQKEAVIGVIKEETESEIANYTNSSRKGSYLKFNSDNVTQGRSVSDRDSLSKFDEIKVDDQITKEEYCALLKKTVKDLFLEKKQSLEEDFKRKEVYFLGIISELKMKNCDLVESSLATKQALKAEIEEEEKKKYEIFKRNLKQVLTEQIEEEQLQKFQSLKIENNESLKNKEKELIEKYEKLKIETKEKYKNLEEKLRKKFVKESQIFVESIQKEMQDILDSKGLTEQRRKKLEEEVKEELKSKLLKEHAEEITKKVEKEIEEKLEARYRKSKDDEIEQLKEIVKTQFQKKRQFLEESNQKILEQKIKEKFEKLKIKFEQEKKILELKLEEERFELEKKRKLLEIKLSYQDEVYRGSKSQPQTTRERIPSDKKGQKLEDETEEEIRNKYKSMFENKEKKYKKIINQLSLKMGQIQERVKIYFRQMEDSRRHEDLIQVLEEREKLLKKREEELEDRIEEFKLFNHSALMYSDITCSQISQISAISRKPNKQEKEFFLGKDNKVRTNSNDEEDKDFSGLIDTKGYETGNFGQGKISLTPNQRSIEKKSGEVRSHSLDTRTAKKEDLTKGIIEAKQNITTASKNNNIITPSVQKNEVLTKTEESEISNFHPPQAKRVESSKDIREFYQHAISSKNPYLNNPNNSPSNTKRPPLSPSPKPKKNPKTQTNSNNISIAPEISYINDPKKPPKIEPSPAKSRLRSKTPKKDQEGKVKKHLIKSDRKSVNILKSIFLVKDKDDANTISLKKLRDQINILREKDHKYKQSYKEKIEKLTSQGYLHCILKQCDNLVSKNHPKEVEDIQKKLIELEELWDTLFTGYEQRLYLLNKIMSSKDDNFKDFYLRLKTNISLEIDFLNDKISSKKHLLAMLEEREKVKIEIYEASKKYKKHEELKNMVTEMRGSLAALKNLNLRILGEVERMKKSGSKESDLKVFGIKFDLLARVDIWEEDYMRKTAEGMN